MSQCWTDIEDAVIQCGNVNVEVIPVISVL